MHRIDTSTAVADLPAPGAPGPNPNGFWTGGNAQVGQSPTYGDPDWFNMVQEEFAAILEAADIAPVKGTYNQVLTSIKALLAQHGVHGQCQLAFTSGASLTLKPYNGSNIIIDGVQYQIPAAGIIVTNAGLAASTRYYVYAYVNNGALALELSATGHSTDTSASNLGIEIKTGDSSRTLVGMVYTTAATQFSDTDSARYVLSWFNRRRKKSQTGFTAARSTTSNSYVEMNSEVRNGFITWADEPVLWSFNTTVLSSAGALASDVSVAFDGTVNEPEQDAQNTTAANQAVSVTLCGAREGLDEGSPHYLTVLGRISGTNSLSISSVSSGFFPSALIVIING